VGSVLVVCTGNICRSPLGEGFLRRALQARLGDATPEVGSAGTFGWEGSGATSESVEAGAERGLDVSEHVARRLVPQLVEDAALVVTMTAEHRDEVVAMLPSAAARTFTLKELARLAEALPAPTTPADLESRVAAATSLRSRGFEGNPFDEDVTDPLGAPLDTYRAIAWEIETYADRMAEALLGPATVPVGEED
jgi:protein-tyrosine phosphatase